MSFRKAGFFAKTLEFSLIKNDYAFFGIKTLVEFVICAGAYGPLFYFYDLLLEWGHQGKSGFVSRVFS